MFQKTIISKYLKTQNKENLIQQWDLFCAHFHNPEIQENIRNSKEEQYQEGFLRDLFVKIFGYTLNPTIGFNLTTEYKNIKDSKKADGAIIIDENVVGVIELKGTNTTDLGKVEEQAFNYKNNQTGCKYVITSNFEKLRLYIDDSVRFVEFNLFTLQKDDFNLLYLLLSFDNIKNDIPKKLKDESLNQEDIVTKKLYKDYSVFKRELFQNLTLLNPEYDPLLLFQKSQKLLDRLLFLLFGEDRGLLPPNSVRQILEQWDKLKDLDAYDPLYNRYKKYFGYLNTGFKGKNHDVFAYNGGLFKEDEILDQIKIGDDLLYQHTFRLSQYDFASEVDVNILGHIFENSLNEIDEIKAQLEGTEIDKSKTKRKKDGVFYTPKYITKYIVENTVGKLCEEKKTEFQIVEEDYFTDKKRQQKTKENLLAKLDQYRNWLLQITIVDPACGSGAFLNEALNFLIEEHQYVDELEAKLLNVPIIFSYHSESILEYNLFGVDLNEESVEIAKLSLWLRTAEPNRKLNSLNDNIKCGNSLIDDPDVAGDKAFNWEKEFPKVFEKGGFDVVIGNPPYVGIEGINEDLKDYFRLNYLVAEGRFDLYTLFIEKAMLIKKDHGSFSFIIPGKILNNKQFRKAREIICRNHEIEVLKIHDKVFNDAQVDSVIIINHYTHDVISSIYRAFKISSEKFIFLSETKMVNIINDFDHIFKLDVNDNINSLLEKIKYKTCLVQDIAHVKDGVINGLIKDKLIVNKKINDSCKELYYGKNIKRYFTGHTDVYIDYRPEIMKQEELIRKKGKAPGLRMRVPEIFEREKILTRFVGKEIVATYDNSHRYYEHTLHSTHVFRKDINHKYLLTLYNSKLINFYYKKTNSQGGDIFPQVRISSVENLPIKIIDIDKQSAFINMADQMLILNEELKEVSSKFQRTLEREFSLETLSKKLQTSYELSYDDFLKELKKQKVELTLSQKADWEHYFDQEKNKAVQIQSQITSTDQEIDRMVYELYGLTEEEIEIVEKG